MASNDKRIPASNISITRERHKKWSLMYKNKGKISHLA